ncbi:hypothetical protein vBEliSR6L_78 [Erythrobacter phage vB_EliS_R6L]|nr:hypothetical protein vBEliSR6L_78 [Erythrobacter phage vB_EliS_R6L]
MATKKISELVAASTPLSGDELVEIVQGGENKRVASSELGGGGGGGPGLSEVVTIADANSNLLASQMGGFLRFTAGTAKILTVQSEATEAMPENGEWHLRNVGAADLTLAEGVGVTIHPPSDGTLVIPQGGTVTIKRVAEDEFDLFGQVVPA